MNLQNKIYGRAFALIGLIQEYYDEKPEWTLFDGGINWRLNQATLEGYGIGDDIVEDFVGQLNSLGTLEEIRLKLGLEPYSGFHRGLVLKHTERPEIMAAVTVMSGPRTGYNPSVFKDRNMDVQLDCFIDVDRLGATEEEDRGLENEMNIMNALTGMGMGVAVEEGDSSYKGTEEVKDSMVESINLYKSLAEEVGEAEEKMSDYMDYFKQTSPISDSNLKRHFNKPELESMVDLAKELVKKYKIGLDGESIVAPTERGEITVRVGKGKPGFWVDYIDYKKSTGFGKGGYKYKDVIKLWDKVKGLKK